MTVQGLTLKQSMPNNIQAIMPQQEDKFNFEKNLIELIKHLLAKPNESEEFQKNLIKVFIQSCLPKNFINTYGRTDLAIYNGPSPSSTVGVLIETKSLSNRSEMISKTNYNTKAFQEILHYYLNERLVNNNIEIKKCIITNGLEWFIIEAKEIEKHFVKNKQLKTFYEKWRLGQLSNITTDFLYREVLAPAINKAINNKITLARFDLRDKLKDDNNIIIKKNNLTQLYRFYTPENLLNKEIFTDSNKLNKGFYDELLYLMGLEEVMSGNKKIIQRLPENKRQIGSFVENIIDRLQITDVEKEEQFETAVQLTVVWTNRILFLKLLEGQLVAFNGDENYKFLTKELLPTFDDVYYLFFGVLAKKVHERTKEMKDKFPHIPYLNSSLFEESNLELSRDGISIDRLRSQQIQFYPKTVLRDQDGKRTKGNVEFLTYLFNFLEAYDFTTSVRHNNNNKNNLINAAVLGLIFEKINGYKEGSFYTPGRITMFMSKNAVRKSVVEKINEIKGWTCNNIYDVKFNIKSLEVAKEINGVINTLKICDPAVGSGHFLVSALNELIAIKSELGILIDSDGYSMNIRCTVVNDELVIQDFNGDNFIYKRGNFDSERIQKTIFQEKRELIENCLFGVDINPNSANICRLRLWIELLKSSYYYVEKDSNIQQLVTLPNIDINIKVGNSLLHKFGIHDGLDQRFSEFKAYTQLVSEYKNTNNKRKKQELIKQIEEIKQKFISSIVTPESKRVTRLKHRLEVLGQGNFFNSKEEEKKRNKEFVKIERKLKVAIKDMEYLRQNPIFRRGLEWRMEFPEILDDTGNFVGFDVVIANPPYIYSTHNSFSESEKRYFEGEYPLNSYQANTYGLFLELSFKILRKNGYSSMIIPNTFLTIGQYKDLRNHILEKTGDIFILNSYDKIFVDASVDNCIVNFKLTSPNTVTLAELRDDDITEFNEINPEEVRKFNVINISAFTEGKTDNISSIMEKINSNSLPIQDYGDVKDGLKAYERGKGNPKQPEDVNEFEDFKKDRTYYSDIRVDNTYRKFLNGPDVNRYKLNWSGQYLKYGENLAAKRNAKIFTGERILIKRIPANSIYAFLATKTNDEYVHEQSIERIGDLKAPSAFLLGVLNSKVESYWGIHKFDFLQRTTFPQLRLYQIKELPIPNATQEEQNHLVHLVEKQIKLNSIFEPTEQNLEEITKLNIDIDEYVMDLFRLSDKEKQVIREFSIG